MQPAGAGRKPTAEEAVRGKYLCRYMVTKVSWRGNYNRIMGCHRTGFDTIDPKDMSLTNEWDYSELAEVQLSEADATEFTVVIRGRSNTTEKFRCAYRSHLLSHIAQHKSLAYKTAGASKPFPASKLTRNQRRLEIMLEVGAGSLNMLAPDGSRLSQFLYKDIECVREVSDDASAFVLNHVGRGRFFMVADNRRQELLHHMAIAAAKLGVPEQAVRARAGTAIGAKAFIYERAAYGSENAHALAQFEVAKPTTRQGPGQPTQGRKLLITTHALVERDADTFAVRLLARDYSCFLVFCFLTHSSSTCF
jgi:hypothetical protein